MLLPVDAASVFLYVDVNRVDTFSTISCNIPGSFIQHTWGLHFSFVLSLHT